MFVCEVSILPHRMILATKCRNPLNGVLTNRKSPLVLMGRFDLRAGVAAKSAAQTPRSGYPPGERMRAAIASPIIIVVKCVLAWQSNGMIDASATRRFAMPFTRPSGSTTPRGSS